MNKRGLKTKLLWQNPEYRKHMSEVHKGFKRPPFTQEHKDKIRKTLTGRKRPKEVGINISKAKKGKPQPNQRGKNNRFWKGGLTSLKVQIKNLIYYHNWRSTVFIRDNFICQSCFIRGGKLEVHHIKPYSKIISEYQIKKLEDAINCFELWDVNNGLTLCRKCHQKTDSYGRIKHV